MSSPSSSSENLPPLPRPVPVIWTVITANPNDTDYVIRCAELAAAAGATGIEISRRTVDDYVTHRAFPALAKHVDQKKLATHQASLRQIGETCRRLGLRLGIWHHEVMGPEGLLDLMPELRAADGFIDLEGPLLYEFMREKCAEFLDLFPCVDELVLTLTETEYPVAHRPFSAMPVPERLRRLIQSIADATEPRERTLVIRPFSAIRADELDVAEALSQVKATRLAVMYKTEPYDWNPFLPDEDRIGTLPQFEARAESDAGAEYYGQADFPCCYARFVARRFDAALARGASVCVIRVDRHTDHCGLGTPLNEVNIIAPTRYLLGRDESIDAAWASWMTERHGHCPAGMVDLCESTFDVIKGSLYLNEASLSHRAFPTYEQARHILTFALFEENISLDHLPEHWSMIPGSRTLSHAGILQEKVAALELAQKIRADFERIGATLEPAARAEIAEALDRLPLLAASCLGFCRLTIAHCEGMLDGAPDTFDAEAQSFLNIAAEIERRLGAVFFRKMPASMRSIVQELKRERTVEIPLRASLRCRGELLDYVLCGFSTEMHSVAKRLHTGDIGYFADRMFRATGIGPAEGCGYTLRSQLGAPLQLTILLAGEGSGPGFLEVRGKQFPLPPGSGDKLSQHDITLDPGEENSLTVRVWGTTALPIRLAGIELKVQS